MKSLGRFLGAALTALTLYGGGAECAADFSITASLMDPVDNAAQKAAVVEVRVSGIHLVDPSFVPQTPGNIEAHLNYRLDEESTVATSANKLSFRDLSPGLHRILVYLADGNQLPIGMPVILMLTIPTVKAVMSY